MESKPDFVIGRSKKILKLNKTIDKILYAAPAYYDTYVVLGQQEKDKEPKPDDQNNEVVISTFLLHVDINGKVLFYFLYPTNSVKVVSMLSSSQVIYLNTPQKTIDIIDLKTEKVLQIKHQFPKEELMVDSSFGVQFFSESLLFCIWQKNSSNSRHLRLTYYSYSKLEEDMRPVVDWIAGKQEWNNNICTLRKVNNHSKFGWWGEKNKINYLYYGERKEVFLKCFDLKHNSKGSTTTYNITEDSKVCGVWEMSPEKFMVMAFPHPYLMFPSILNPKKPIMLKIDLITNPRDHQKFQYTECQADVFGVGVCTVIHRCIKKNENQAIIPSPVSYIDNETETLLETEQWKRSEKCELFVPCWSDFQFWRVDYGKGTNEVSFQEVRVFDLKFPYLHFLLTLNEDFDDDLLQDTVSSLIDL